MPSSYYYTIGELSMYTSLEMTEQFMRHFSVSIHNTNKKVLSPTMVCKSRTDYKPMLRVAAFLVIAGAAVNGVSQSQTLQLAKAAPQLEVYTASEASLGVTSTLIYGKTEAFQVDAQFHISDATRLADHIAVHQVRLKAVFVTHPDDDHYFGLAVLHERFPSASIYMTANALEELKRTVADSLAGAKKRYQSEIPDSAPTPEPLPTTEFLIDGQSIQILPDLFGPNLTVGGKS